MAAGYAIAEVWESPSQTGGTEPQRTVTYTVHSTGNDDVERETAFDDDDGVLAFVKAQAPGTINGVPRQTIKIDRLAMYAHVAVVEYHFTEFSANEHSFDTTGGTSKIFRSFSTTSSGAPAGQSAPNYYSLIGVTRESVEGVDVVVPAYASKIVKRISPTLVTDAFKRALFRATGTVNSVPFKEYGVGECLFLGASGNQVNNDFWQITYGFAGQATINNIQIPTPDGPMTVAEKIGWDYLWVRYVDRQDDASKSIIKAPQAWYVERVYRFTDLNQLGV